MSQSDSILFFNTYTYRPLGDFETMPCQATRTGEPSDRRNYDTLPFHNTYSYEQSPLNGFDTDFA